MTSTTAAGSGWAPDQVSAFGADDMLGTALIINAATKAGNVEGDSPKVIVPYVSADPNSAIVDEGAAITEDDGTLDQVEISTYKVATLTKVSRELVAQPGAAERIALSLRRSVTAKADNVFLSNASAPTGLLKVTGVDNAGTIGDDAFAAYDAVAAIEDDGGQATNLLVNPADWATLSKIPETSGSNKSALTDLHDASQRSLAGVPVTVHSAVTQGTALMLDRSEVVAAYGQLELARSEHVYFASDAVGIRATWRIGFEVVRTARLQLLTVSTTTA